MLKQHNMCRFRQQGGGLKVLVNHFQILIVYVAPGAIVVLPGAFFGFYNLIYLCRGFATSVGDLWHPMPTCHWAVYLRSCIMLSSAVLLQMRSSLQTQLLCTPHLYCMRTKLQVAHFGGRITLVQLLL
jgi:hypothetical protein